jgi:hypothetical protein
MPGSFSFVQCAWAVRLGSHEDFERAWHYRMARIEIGRSFRSVYAATPKPMIATARIKATSLSQLFRRRIR